MLGGSRSYVAQRKSTFEHQNRTTKYKSQENEVKYPPAPKSGFHFTQPLHQKLPQQPVMLDQKENKPFLHNIPTPDYQDPLKVPMKQQSKQPLTPGSKRRLENTDFPAYREFSKKSKINQKTGSSEFGNLEGIKTEIENLEQSDLNRKFERPTASAKKPKMRKQTNQSTDPPTPQGFAHFTSSQSNTSFFSTDPLQCNEEIFESEGFCGAIPTPVEKDIPKVKTPLSCPSTGPSGIATPTRSRYPKNTVDFDKVSENLRKIATTSDFGLLINSEHALALKTQLSPLDVPLFESSFSIWLNDIKAEEVVTGKISPDSLCNHRDVSPLSRWVVLNWIRDVCVEHRMSRQSFHSAIQLLDIFISNFDFNESNFQLVAVTALLIALKVHETAQYPIAFLVEFVWDEEIMTPQENQANIDFAKKFLLKYEYKMMKLMNWNVMLPSPLDFLRHSLQFAALLEGIPKECYLPEGIPNPLEDRGADTVLHQKYDTMMFACAAAILDRAAMDYYSLSFLGSQIAAAVFWIVYPKKGSKDDQEKVLLAATGYKLDQIHDCIEFLEPYKNIDDHTIMEILNSELMVDLFQRLSADDQDFKLEEHQLPGIQTPVDYDRILEQRANKLGKPHVLSHWHFQ